MVAFRRSFFLYMLLLLFVAGCTQVRELSSLDSHVQQNSSFTAETLNFRLSRTVAECPGGGSLFDCSGVLVRDVASGDPATFWKLGAGAQQDFLLLRDDAPVIKPEGKVGFVFLDRLSAVARDKPYKAAQVAGSWHVAVDNWNEEAPASVAFEAVYYDYADPKALLRAHNAQRAYFDVTGEWLPVLRYARSETGQVRFGFNQMEQLYYGYSVAAQLNARYADSRSSCISKPGEKEQPPYYCSGVLLRTTDVGNFHAWDPSPKSINGGGVSFSWFRADQAIIRTYKPQGFVMAPMSAPVAYHLTLKCIYPFDAGTGGASNMCTFRGSCRPDYDTLEKWVATYRSRPNVSCAIDPDVQGVQLNTEIRNDNRVDDKYGWNEWMIATWPLNIGRDLPLEVFFHTKNSGVGGNGLLGAKNFQRDYLNTDSRYIPVVELVPLATDGYVFTYTPLEQSVD